MPIRVSSRGSRELGTVILWSAIGASIARADLEIQVPLPGPGGQTRRMLLHLPPTLPGPGPIPVVLGFHGGFGDAESFRSLTGLNLTADARGFAVAYMDAGDGVWGDYRPGPGQPDADLAYVRAAMEYLVANHHADPRRFYATGLSNGAAFSFVLGSELSDRIAAIAPVAHNLSQAFVDQATPAGPMHVLQIVGTADPIMPFTGGVQGTGDPVISSAATMEYWRMINGNGPSTSVPLPDLADDGTAAIRETFAPSPEGYALERIVVLNGGHTWPGGEQYLPVSTIGLTSRDFSANEVIWDFFSDKTLPVPTPNAVVILLGAAGAAPFRRRAAGVPRCPVRA
jgi:polyhydroxybutyrate depolymerase